MRKFCYAAIGVLLLLIGCNISDIDTEGSYKLENLRSDIAVPFGTASYTMLELVQELESEENFEHNEETGEIRFLYQDQIEYTFSSDLFDVPNNSESTELFIQNAFGPTTFSETLNFKQTYESQEGEIIDSVYHETTSAVRVAVGAVTTIEADLDFTLTLLNTVDRNTEAPMVFTGTLSGGFSPSETRSLANYKTLLEEELDSNRYNIQIDLSANLGIGENFSSDQISVSIEFLDQDFEIVFGKFGRDTVDFALQTLDVAFFEELAAEGIEFGGATMTFDITNTFGIPIGMGFNKFYGEKEDGSRVYLNGSVINSPPVIASATLNTSTYEPIEEPTQIEVNALNSTIGSFLGESPSTIGFEIQGFTNSENANAWNFVTDDAMINADIEIDIPLEVSLNNVQHSLDFDIPGGVDLNEIDSMELRLVTVNELPFNATLDMYILGDTLNTGVVDSDTLYQVLDKSALDQPFLNFDRTVREPKIAVEDIPLGSTGTKELARGEVIRVVITMNSPATQTSESIYVKLLSTAKIDVTLGVRGIIDVEL